MDERAQGEPVQESHSGAACFFLNYRFIRIIILLQGNVIIPYRQNLMLSLNPKNRRKSNQQTNIHIDFFLFVLHLK
jgi:hypothetical protein